jgi:hypothetical protein
MNDTGSGGSISAVGAAQTAGSAATSQQQQQQQQATHDEAPASRSHQPAGDTMESTGSNHNSNSSSSSSTSTSNSRRSRKPRTLSEVAALASSQDQAAGGPLPSQDPPPSQTRPAPLSPSNASPSTPSSTPHAQQDHQQLQQGVASPLASPPVDGQPQAHDSPQAVQSAITNPSTGSSSSSSTSSHSDQQKQLPKQQQQQQQQQRGPRKEHQLESLAGLSLLLQAAWAVLHDTRSGKGVLASSLARSWGKQGVCVGGGGSR